MTLVNRIPFGRGLGSSAAAIVGGLVAADALAETGFSRLKLLQLALPWRATRTTSLPRSTAGRC
jgi:homoserine kinase